MMMEFTRERLTFWFWPVVFPRFVAFTSIDLSCLFFRIHPFRSDQTQKKKPQNWHLWHDLWSPRCEESHWWPLLSTMEPKPDTSYACGHHVAGNLSGLGVGCCRVFRILKSPSWTRLGCHVLEVLGSKAMISGSCSPNIPLVTSRL